MLHFQLDEVSPEVLDPINWAVAGVCGLISVLASWYWGCTLLTTAYLAAVTFLGTFLWCVADDRGNAEVASRQNEMATTDALTSVYAVKLGQVGINGAFLGVSGLLLIHRAIKADWAMLGVVGLGFASTIAYLYISRREVLSDAIKRAWTRHVIVMNVLGVIAAASALVAGRIVSAVGKSWPKALAFGINPRSMAVGYILLAIGILVWIANQRLAQRAAKAAAEDDLHDAPTIGSFERAPRSQRNRARRGAA